MIFTIKIIKKLFIFSLLGVSFWYFLPFSCYANSLITIYIVGLLKRWFLISILIIMDHNNFTVNRIIYIYIVSFIPTGLIMYCFKDLFVLSDPRICMVNQPTTDRFRINEILGDAKRIEYIYTFNYEYELFKEKSRREKLEAFDSCVEKLRHNNAYVNMNYSDVCIIKYMGSLNLFSEQAKTILLGLANDEPISARRNRGSYTWTQQGIRREIIRTEMLQKKSSLEFRITI